MFYNQNDDRPHIYFVKLPQIEQKFAMGCNNLRSASVGDIMDLAKDVAKNTKFVYKDEPVVYCWEFGTIIADDTALSFCVSKGCSFEVIDGIATTINLSAKENVETVERSNSFVSATTE